MVSVNEFAYNLEFIVKTAKYIKYTYKIKMFRFTFSHEEIFFVFSSFCKRNAGCDVAIIAPPPVDRDNFHKYVADGTYRSHI